MGASATFDRFRRERRNRRCARAFLRALNERAFERLALLLAPEATHTDSQFTMIEGSEGIVRAFRRLMALVPDWRFELEELMVNDRVAMIRGQIHTELPEIAREILATLVFEDGRIVEIQEMHRRHDSAPLMMADPRETRGAPMPTGPVSKIVRRVH